MRRGGSQPVREGTSATFNYRPEKEIKNKKKTPDTLNRLLKSNLALSKGRINFIGEACFDEVQNLFFYFSSYSTAYANYRPLVLGYTKFYKESVIVFFDDVLKVSLMTFERSNLSLLGVN